MPNNKQAIIAYIPSWHMGYKKFFDRYKGPIYLLSKDSLKHEPRLDRDIRAVDAADMMVIIRSLYGSREINIWNNSYINDIQATPVIMPDEETSHNFARQNLKGTKVHYVKVFLRWDRMISTVEHQVPENRTVSTSDADIKVMGLALKEATKSPDWWRQVGAVAITRNGKVLKAHNSPMPSHDYTLNTFGDPRSNFDAGEYIEMSKCIHAEAKLIAQAANEGISLLGATIYITTYPCPPCAKSLAVAGFEKVCYKDGYSVLDAEDILNAYGVQIVMVKEKI